MTPSEQPRTVAATRKRRIKPPQPRRSETVLSQLKEDILSGRIARGDRLYESVIGRQYGASRTPVREALMRTLQDGLIQKSGRAYIVRDLSLDEVKQLYDVRECLECRAVVLTVERIEPAQVLLLSEHLELMADQIRKYDVAAFNKLDSEFHLLLARLSGNAFLEGQLRSVHDWVRIVRTTWFSARERQLAAHEEHIRVVKAIERRDMGVATAEMCSHIRSSIAILAGMSIGNGRGVSRDTSGRRGDDQR